MKQRRSYSVLNVFWHNSEITREIGRDLITKFNPHPLRVSSIRKTWISAKEIHFSCRPFDSTSNNVFGVDSVEMCLRMLTTWFRYFDHCIIVFVVQALSSDVCLEASPELINGMMVAAKWRTSARLQIALMNRSWWTIASERRRQ